jgi:O-antigen ligase
MIKPLVVVGGILIGLIPWAGGGRDAAWIMAVSFALVITWLLIQRDAKPKTVVSLALRIATAAWIGWAALSLTWSVNRFQTETWLLYAILAVITFTLTANLKTEERRWLISGYVWVAAIAAVAGIFLYLSGDYDRLTSTFYWANPAAAYFIPAGLIAGWRWLDGRRWFNGVMALILATAFWLTDSRGAALVLVLIVASSLIFSSRLRQYWVRLLILAVASVALALGISALKSAIHPAAANIAPGSRYSAAAQGESSSAKLRWNYWVDASAVWWAHPIIGTGAGTFATVHPQYQRDVVSATSDPHNVYLQTLAEQGIVGAIILAWVVILLLLGVLRGVGRKPEHVVVALGILALLLHFGIDIDARYPALLLLLAALLGSTYAPWRRLPISKSQVLILPTLLAVALLASVSNYLSAINTKHGEIYNDNHDLTAAANAFGKAHSGLMYDPDNWTAEGIDYYVLATITNGSKQNQALALDRANQAISRDPKDSQHYSLRGKIERLGGNLDGAESDFKRAIALDNHNHAGYYLDLAGLQLQRGREDSANDTVVTAIGLYPDSVINNRSADTGLKPTVASLLAVRALKLQSVGDTAGAQSSIKRAVLLDPSNGDVKRAKQALGLT